MDIPGLMIGPFKAVPIIYQSHDQRTFWGGVERPNLARQRINQTDPPMSLN